jgi:hypothetical protein
LSWDVPNYFTLAAEIAVAIFIALYFHRIQSNNNKVMKDVMDQIESYTKGKKSFSKKTQKDPMLKYFEII